MSDTLKLLLENHMGFCTLLVFFGFLSFMAILALVGQVADNLKCCNSCDRCCDGSEDENHSSDSPSSN